MYLFIYLYIYGCVVYSQIHQTLVWIWIRGQVIHQHLRE